MPSRSSDPAGHRPKKNRRPTKPSRGPSTDSGVWAERTRQPTEPSRGPAKTSRQPSMAPRQWCKLVCNNELRILTPKLHSWLHSKPICLMVYQDVANIQVVAQSQQQSSAGVMAVRNQEFLVTAHPFCVVIDFLQSVIVWWTSSINSVYDGGNQPSASNLSRTGYHRPHCFSGSGRGSRALNSGRSRSTVRSGSFCMWAKSFQPAAIASRSVASAAAMCC